MLALAAATTLDAGAAATIEVAGRAGFDACGLRPASAELGERSVAELARRFADGGLSLLDVEVIRLGAGERDVDPLRLLDFAARLSARFVLVVSHHLDAGRSAEELAWLADVAAGHGLRIAVEFMRFTAIPTLPSALEVIRRTGRSDVAVVVDALHLQRSGGGPADLRRIPPGCLAYVQLCDAVAAAPADVPALAEEARHRRLLPGTGALPLRELVARLDPAVPLSVEVQSDELARTVAPGARARLAFEHARGLLAATSRRPGLGLRSALAIVGRIITPSAEGPDGSGHQRKTRGGGGGQCRAWVRLRRGAGSRGSAGDHLRLGRRPGSGCRAAAGRRDELDGS